MIPSKADGLQISADVQKLGLIAAPSVSYSFTDTAILASCMLGEPENRGVIRAATLYSILRASVGCGMARAALEYAMDYAKERIAFGRPIVSYQSIAFMVSEMAMKLDGARLLLWRAATSWDRMGVGYPQGAPLLYTKDEPETEYSRGDPLRSPCRGWWSPCRDWRSPCCSWWSPCRDWRLPCHVWRSPRRG